MENNNLKEFQWNIINVFRCAGSNCNTQELIYLLSYLSYMDCKLKIVHIHYLVMKT